jgi:crossover junction endonuclease MUS81
MIIKVDTREPELLQKLNHLTSSMASFKNIIVKSETLPIGDIIICDETEEKLIIERKSISDLLSSIKDGRYEEQSYRLNGLNHHNHNIIYLVEGDVNKNNYFKSRNDNEKLMAYSAMFSLNYYKGFSVFRSFSLEETAMIICNMAYKLEKDNVAKKAFYKNNVHPSIETNLEENLEQSDEVQQPNMSNITEQSEKDYVNVVKKVKKDNITPDNIGAIMLCQIPGISSVTALAIMEQYKSLPNLIKELETNNYCLKDISSTNPKGQTRKINKTSLANIVKFLLKK